MKEKEVSPSKKVLMLEKFLRRIVGSGAIFRYRRSMVSDFWSEIEIVNPNAEDLVDCFHGNEYHSLDFSSELVEGDKLDYWPIWLPSGKTKEGFLVCDKTTGDTIGITKKYDSALIATIQLYEDPYEELQKLKKFQVTLPQPPTHLTNLSTPKKRGRPKKTPDPQPTP